MIFLLALACDNGEAPDSAAEGDPTIALISPREGQTVCRDPLSVVVEVTGLELVPPPADATEAEPGTGHIDVTLNGQEAEMVWESEFEVIGWDNDGEYQLKVELSNADHTAVEPYAGDLVYITLSGDACL